MLIGSRIYVFQYIEFFFQKATNHVPRMPKNITADLPNMSSNPSKEPRKNIPQPSPMSPGQFPNTAVLKAGWSPFQRVLR